MASWYLLEDFILRNYIALIPILFSIQILLNDFMEIYLFMNLKAFWFKFLIAPGTILHELSHAFAAKLTGCRITSISLFHFNEQGTLGSVEYTQPRDGFSVLRTFIVGFAPFFGCGIVLIALLNLVQSHYPGGVLTADIVDAGSIQSILESIGLIVRKFYQQFQLGGWDIILLTALYLQICFGLGAAPSSVDFKGAFSSCIRHPLGTFLLILAFASIIYLGEYPLTSIYIVLFFRWVLLTLLVSISLLLASIPLIYLGTKFTEFSLPKKFFTVAVPAFTYILADDMFLTLIVFLTTFFILKYSWVFLKPE
jgi:hypothetical protein